MFRTCWSGRWRRRSPDPRGGLNSAARRQGVTQSKRLIVNADDLGRTEGINRGILEAHRRGIVTSATLMVNYPAADAVPAIARDNPGLGIGLHVQLTGGPSALPPEGLRSMVDSSGRLPSKPEGLLEPGSTELMCHPAVVDDELRAGSGYAEPRARELEVLTREEARRAVREGGIELVHFGQL